MIQSVQDVLLGRSRKVVLFNMYYLVSIFPVVLMAAFVSACFKAAGSSAGYRKQTQMELLGILLKSWVGSIILWYFILTILLLGYRLILFAWTGSFIDS